MVMEGTRRAVRGTEESGRGLLKALGQRVVRLRTEKGWSRVELAQELGVSRERLAKWERGSNAPPLRILVALKRVLGITLEELVTGEPWGEGGLSSDDRVIAAVCLDQLATVLRLRGVEAQEGNAEPESKIDLPGHEGPEV
jgi:transcriptional regulator with XRE-family HTH domain